jgi:hypothetical protein
MSFHLTFGVLTITAREVARRLLDGAGAWLDRPLPLRFGERPATLAETVEQVRSDLLTAIAAVDTGAVTDGLRSLVTTKHLDRRRVTGRLRVAADPGRISTASMVERARGVALSTREDGDEAVIELADCRLRLPRSTYAALRYVVDHETFRVGDLPGLDEQSAAVLVRRLVREGALAPVPISRSPLERRPHPART